MATQTTHSDGIPIIPESSANSGTTRTTMNGNIKIKALPAEFYDRFLSDRAKQLQPSPIRGLYPLEKKPGVISLLAGKPEPSTFPFTSLTFTAKDPSKENSESTITISQDQLSPGLQYSDTAGIPDLLKWITTLQEIAHGRKHGMHASGEGEEGWRLSIGSGSQDLISKSATALINPGDSVLVESPVYAGVIPIFKHMDCKQIEVPTDAHGIRASSLKEILENWPEGEKRPKLLYTVPYGCNPTGMTASLERRKEVLKLARQYNFIILEVDDPYYYLYYGKSARPTSYFALEVTEPCGEEAGEVYCEVGRVLRFDSLSKILSAGLRIGFATGPQAILRKVDMLTANANLQVSSLTQLIAFRLLDSWGYDKFFVHTKNVSAFYAQKRDIFERELKKWLGGGVPEEGEIDEGRLADWVSPEAGMFFWQVSYSDEQDSRTLIETHAYANGVLALPGTVFLPNGSKTPYVRASFSLLTEEQMVEAMKRLRKTVIEVRSERANR
ncbi:PLP-dependent transferase [Lentinula boryana]|uniref:PLP-dependent transferase n=1 Tax=Lentinula boryana TaxID=40481 RepID=A0ABQ8Q0E1_9AGAR|nr:PLP-dependent transferase [Lentinula boryana]